MTAILLHGFGARYDLPLSLALYLYAAGGVVVISFVLVAIFAGEKTGERALQYPRRRVPFLDRAAASPLPRAVGGAIAVLTLAAVISTGLLGSSQPTRNPAEYLLWIYFWAGLVILSGLVGNLWTLVNPWAALYDLAGRLIKLPAGRPLPARLGMWPAVIAYFAFACLELTSGAANRPALIGSLVALYALVMLAGMVVFGREAWLSRVDAFSVLFAIIGRFAPVEVETGAGRPAVWLRPWGVGLLKPVPAGWDRIVFIVLMLSTLAFDGILATPLWAGFISLTAGAGGAAGSPGFVLIRTLGLVLLTGIFLAMFVVITRLVLFFGWDHLKSPLGRWPGVDWVAGLTAFALTLVPIALVYNAAHNYGYLVVQSQGLVPLLADPFAKGWNLLPTAGYQPSFALAGAAVVWYVQVVLIVIGHIIAVYLAHLRAGERFRGASRVLVSQYPMLLLMVLYTMTSLWILAQPVTREV